MSSCLPDCSDRWDKGADAAQALYIRFADGDGSTVESRVFETTGGSEHRHRCRVIRTVNYNGAYAAEFSRAIHRHINAPVTRQITGTYRGNSVVHNVDPATGLNVIEDTAGNFVSGWRLNADQL